MEGSFPIYSYVSDSSFREAKNSFLTGCTHRDTILLPLFILLNSKPEPHLEHCGVEEWGRSRECSQVKTDKYVCRGKRKAVIHGWASKHLRGNMFPDGGLRAYMYQNAEVCSSNRSYLQLLHCLCLPKEGRKASVNRMYTQRFVYVCVAICIHTQTCTHTPSIIKEKQNGTRSPTRATVQQRKWSAKK